MYLLCGSGRGGNASPTGIDGRCAGILDGESVVKPGDAGVYGVCPRLGVAAIRLVAGLVMVLLIATLVQKWVRETPQTQAPVEIDIPEAQGGFLAAGAGRYGRFSGVRSVYILAVLVLGAARVWLFPMLMVLSI